MTDQRSKPVSKPAGSGSELLEFERWCELAALVLGRDAIEQLEILAEQDVEPSRWRRSDRHWSLALAADIAAGGSARADGYAERCAAEMARRRQAAARGGAARPSEEPARGAASPPPFDDMVQDRARSIDETAWLLQAPLEPALPFSEPGDGAPPPEVVRATDERPDLAGETALATPAVADAADSLPFISPAAHPEPAATSPGGSSSTADQALARYAALCAELAAYPEHGAVVCARAGIGSSAELAGLHARWQERFRAEPTLRQRRDALQDQHARRLAARAEGPGRP